MLPPSTSVDSAFKGENYANQMEQKTHRIGTFRIGRRLRRERRRQAQHRLGRLLVRDAGLQHAASDRRGRRPYGEYYDDFSTIPLDVNGNGRLDFITGGWWGDTLRWRENPGDPDQEWPEHIIAAHGQRRDARAPGTWTATAAGDRAQHAGRAAGGLQARDRRGRPGDRRVCGAHDLCRKTGPRPRLRRRQPATGAATLC